MTFPLLTHGLHPEVPFAYSELLPRIPLSVPDSFTTSLAPFHFLTSLLSLANVVPPSPLSRTSDSSMLTFTSNYLVPVMAGPSQAFCCI